MNADSKPQHSKIWQQILDSSELMQQVAARQDWDELQQLIDQRQRLLEQFFSEPPSQSSSYSLEQIRRDIDTILQQDERIGSRSKHNRDALMASLQRISKGKRAVKAYR